MSGGGEERRRSSRGARPATVAAVVGIAAAALGLRVWHLGWGLADGMFFPDEWFCWGLRTSWTLAFSWEGLHPNPECTSYPTLYGYLSTIPAAVAQVLGVLTPIPPDAEGVFPREAVPFFADVILIARVVAVLASLLTVWLVGRLAARLYDRRTGLAAAALMAAVPMEAMQVHYASADPLLTACATLVLIAAWDLFRRGSAARAAVAGGVAGLGLATKYTGLMLAAPVAWAIVERAVGDRSVRAGLRLGVAAAAGFTVALLVACPPCALEPGGTLAAMQMLRDVIVPLSDRFRNNALVASLGWYGHPYLYQVVASLPFVLGWPLWALAVGGLVVALVRRTAADRLLWTATLVWFLCLAGTRVTFPRYLLPILPGLVVLAARTACAVSRPRWAGVALVAAVWVYTAALAATQVARFSYDQQRSVVAWIASGPARAVWPAQVRVGVPDYLAEYYRLREGLELAGVEFIRLDDGAWFDVAPEIIVVPEWMAISIARDTPDGALARDLARLRSGQMGYRSAARWPVPGYLQRDLYTRLDPAFDVDLWQGSIGFTVYLRDDMAVAMAARESPGAGR